MRLSNDISYRGNHPRKKSFMNYLFAIVRKKTFVIQSISYIKIPAEIKSARKHSRMLPNLQNL